MDIPPPIQSSEQTMEIRFTSDGSVGGDGFSAQAVCGGRRRQQDDAGVAPVNVTRGRDVIAEANDESFKYNPDEGAFVFLIPLEFSQKNIELNISSLVDYAWMDQKTSDVEVRFATYNGNSRLFSIVHLNMAFYLSGQTSKSLKVSCVNLELGLEAPGSMVRMALEAFVVVAAGMTLLSEMGELLELGWDYFHDPWNYIDPLNLYLYALVRSLALASLSLSVERVDRCVACTGGIHLAVPIRHLGGDFHPK